MTRRTVGVLVTFALSLLLAPLVTGAPPVKVADHRGGMIGGAWLSADTILMRYLP